ncbi:S8 family peptidase [Paraglaciecola sp. 20A4]|uniref:S8 family peptidase n=1 Tax=Paraglaciecola sp. 20A4 TaxID=2687288 RepID=UPI00140D49E0|nr:S8 family peptidase [Paraglaciecola sp. 20A4]
MKLKFNKKCAILLAGLFCFSSISAAGSGVRDIVKSVNATKTPGSLGASSLTKVAKSLVGLDNEVLIQGAEVGVLKDLIESIGGIVTHKLPLVDGIGARLSDAQLILLSQLAPLLKVSKNEAVFTAGSLDNCLVYGSHVSELTDHSIRWNLYNARDSQADMESMSFKWPKELGHIYSVKVNGATVYWRVYNRKSGELSINIKRLKRYAKLDAFEAATVEVSFAAGGAENYSQRDFSLDVKFKQNCSRSLVKGYDTQANEGDSNSYYVNNIGADELHDKGITGKDVTVAVIDSGLWSAHSALSNDTTNKTRIKAAYDALNDEEVAALGVTDENSHGTHITGIIANSDHAVVDGQMRSYYQGVAPDANLVVVKAFYEDGHSTYLDALRALQYIADNHEALNIRVVNLSFGAPPRSNYWDDPINQAVMALWEKDIVVVTSAGNTGPSAMTIGVPANVPYVISVGAISDNYTQDNPNDDTMLSFSSQGPTHEAFIKPDMVAPGGHMFSLANDDMYVPSKFPQYMVGDDRFIMSGTSQASGVVSGVVALMLQNDPSLSANDVKCRLMSSTTMAQVNGKLAYSPFQQGSGSVNAVKAVESNEAGCANNGMDIAADLSGEQHYMGAARKDENGNYYIEGFEFEVWEEAFMWEEAHMNQENFMLQE